MAQTATNRYKKKLGNGEIVPGTTDIRALLLCASSALSHTGVPDMNTVADALGSFTECAVSGYARQALAGESIAEDDANDWALIDSNDIAFGALSAGGNPIVGVAYYVEGASDAARELLQVNDLTSTPPNGSTVTVTTANGITRIT